MHKIISIPYKKIGNFDIIGDIYLTSGKHSPSILYLHGGALIWGSRRDIRPGLFSLLLNNGFTVVSIDYRLAPATKLKEIINDIRDAIDWVKSGCSGLASIDQNRIGVLGNSAGGYLALCSGTFDNRPNAIVSYYGYGSILEDWYTKPSEHYLKQESVSDSEFSSWVNSSKEISSAGFELFPFYVRTRQKGNWSEFVSGESKEELVKYCPIEMIDAQYPPTFLTHGTLDTDVAPSSSKLMSEELQKVGVPCEISMIKDRGHAFDMNEEDPEVENLAQKTLSFFKEHL